MTTLCKWKQALVWSVTEIFTLPFSVECVVVVDENWNSSNHKEIKREKERGRTEESWFCNSKIHLAPSISLSWAMSDLSRGFVLFLLFYSVYTLVFSNYFLHGKSMKRLCSLTQLKWWWVMLCYAPVQICQTKIYKIR